MKNYFKYVIVLVCLSGCQEVEKASKPDHLIPEGKMVDILVDLAKIDAAMNYNQKDFKGKGIDIQAYVYEKYGVDSAQLANNNAYYIEHYEINKRIYEAVKGRLEKQIATLDSLKTVEDSLQLLQQETNKNAPKDSLKSKKKESAQTPKSMPDSANVVTFKEIISADSLR